MVAAEQEKLMTAEELLRLPKGMGNRYELVRGELKIMSPAGFEHGDVGAELLARLRTYVRAKRLGRSCSSRPTGSARHWLTRVTLPTPVSTVIVRVGPEPPVS